MAEPVPHQAGRQPMTEPSASARAVKLLPSGLLVAATVAVKNHEHAIQYLEQAPAVIAFVCHGHAPKRATDIGYFARAFCSAIHRQPRLRTLLAGFGAPFPIRKIHGMACHPKYLQAIYDLRTIPPSVLAQAIPATTGRQMSWLAALTKVRAACRMEPYRQQWAEDLWRWAVPALGAAAEAFPSTRGNPGRRPLRDVAKDVLDMLCTGRVPLNPRWTFQQALAAAEEWHHRLARERTETQTLNKLGFAFDYRFPYGAIPDQLDLPPYSFHALRSGEELFEEGRALRHCVASYIAKVAHGHSYIIGVRQADRRIATVELVPSIGQGTRWRITQIAGPCNAPASDAVRTAAHLYLAQINRLQADGPGATIRGLLAGFTATYPQQPETPHG